MRDTRRGRLALVGVAVLLAAGGCAPQAYQDDVVIIVPVPVPLPGPGPCPAPLPPESPPTQADPATDLVRHAPIDRGGDAGTATKTQEDRPTPVVETPRAKPPRTEPRTDPPANDVRDGQGPVRTRTR